MFIISIPKLILNGTTYHPLLSELLTKKVCEISKKSCGFQRWPNAWAREECRDDLACEIGSSPLIYVPTMLTAGGTCWENSEPTDIKRQGDSTVISDFRNRSRHGLFSHLLRLTYRHCRYRLVYVRSDSLIIDDA